MIGALNYNECKVENGSAKCIYASSFGCDANDLSYQNKLGRLRQQANLNRRSKTNVLHISLNFDPSEKLSEFTLGQIASGYMEKIGFGDQPYLVYKHFDAAHPHIHILTTSIRTDGKRIPLHNLGRIKSEQARKEIECEFNLVKAGGRKFQPTMIHPADLNKVLYGRDETRRAIAEIVTAVTRSYRYASIPELNAVLKQFNVQIIQGAEGSQMKKNRGLMYSLIDGKGNSVGIPIKASALPGKPIFSKLEKQFAINRSLRESHKRPLTDRIESVLTRKPDTFREFLDELARNEIYLVTRRSSDGQIYGLTYIDNNTRSVFNGSDLGRAFSAKAIIERFQSGGSDAFDNAPTFRNDQKTFNRPEQVKTSPFSEMLSELIHGEPDLVQSDPLLKKKRKKRKKRKF